jgi:hypothetical protein
MRAHVKQFLCLLICSTALAADPASSQQKAKVLEWGWSTPPPLYVRDHIAQMEQVPFDGIVMTLFANGKHDPTTRPHRQASFPSRGWSASTINRGDFSESIAALKETKFTRFTDNFLRFNTVPGDVDWFDADFSRVVANLRLLAAIANETGMKGIMLDTEAYDRPLFNYSRQRGVKEHTFVEYQQQARLRGREMMAAVSEAFSDARVIITLAYGMPHGLEGSGPMESQKYGLLPSMLDGMIEGCGERATLFDGWEYAYNNRTKEQYDDNLDTIKRKSLAWSAVPELMKTRWHASFGIWVDYRHKWDPKDFEKNFFTPAEFAFSIHQAMNHTDAYVWIWSEVPSWWNGQMPKPYVDALIDARKPDLAAPPPRKNPF